MSSRRGPALRHSLRLTFDEKCNEVARRRIDYAFRIFCAVYGFGPTDESGALCLHYGHGVCFPYPPYDFEAEQPYPMLELPLVLCDNAVYLAGRRLVYVLRRPAESTTGQRG